MPDHSHPLPSKSVTAPLSRSMQTGHVLWIATTMFTVGPMTLHSLMWTPKRRRRACRVGTDEIWR